MEFVREFGKEDLAKVYVLRMRPGNNHYVECVESLQPPKPRAEKWVLIVSTLFGCPVGCRMCDAGGWYKGRLTSDEILSQIRFLVNRRFEGRSVPVKKFKIQFARMGDPALNRALLEVLERLPREFDAPGLLPSVSSVAPFGSEEFFETLLEVKDRLYDEGRFQLQFSLHSTNPAVRRSLIPVPGLDFAWMGGYGNRFMKPGDQRITLNFAAAKGIPVAPELLLEHFDPERFLIKLTPLNPTIKAAESELESCIDPYEPATGADLVRRFEKAGYTVILSIGEAEENAIGSNCGQYATCVRGGVPFVKQGYASETYSP